MSHLLNKHKIRLVILVLAISVTPHSFAKSTLRKQGDWLSDNLMWIATAHTLYNEYDSDDEDYAWANGLIQLHTSAVVARGLLVTNIKRTVNSTRPDGGSGGFPSGHASKAFSPAWYIYHRYGFKQAAPYLIAATYTGYSRVDAKRHYWIDIIGSAALNYAITHYMVSSADDPNQPKFGIGFDQGGVFFNYDWRW